jgi:hypothetical protein
MFSAFNRSIADGGKSKMRTEKESLVKGSKMYEMSVHLHNRARVRKMQVNTDLMTGARLGANHQMIDNMHEGDGREKIFIGEVAWKETLNGEPSNNKQTWLAVKANRCSSWQLLH